MMIISLRSGPLKEALRTPLGRQGGGCRDPFGSLSSFPSPSALLRFLTDASKPPKNPMCFKLCNLPMICLLFSPPAPLKGLLVSLGGAHFFSFVLAERPRCLDKSGFLGKRRPRESSAFEAFSGPSGGAFSIVKMEVKCILTLLKNYLSRTSFWGLSRPQTDPQGPPLGTLYGHVLKRPPPQMFLFDLLGGTKTSLSELCYLPRKVEGCDHQTRFFSKI